MSFWNKLKTRLLLKDQPTRERLPQERELDHTIRNFQTVAMGAVHLAEKQTRRILDNPKKAELQESRAQSESTIDAVVREMQGKR